MLDTERKTASARPGMTAQLTARTGIDEETLTLLVHRFYARVRDDAILAPVFEDRITDWATHLDRMVDFWSSVALMTGRYHGRPIPAHLSLPVGKAHFDRWLDLFLDTAQELCTPVGAKHLTDRAERIARTLQIAVAQDRHDPDTSRTGPH